MTIQECYEAFHGNYSDAKTRLMNDRLIERFLLKFPADESFPKLLEAIAAKNYSDAFRQVHTLKGVAGNLALTELYTNASNLTEQLRDQVGPENPQLLVKVVESYNLVITTLDTYTKEK